MDLSNLNIEYTIDTLKALNKSWQCFSNLRATCSNFPNSDLILNILSTNMINMHKNIGIGEIDKIYDNDLENNISAIKTIWDSPFSIELIEKCVQIILEDYTFIINSNDKKQLEDNCFNILKSDNDPVIKTFLLHIILENALKHIEKKNKILRIFNIYFLHYQGFLEHPVLYHPTHFSSFLNVNEYIDNTNTLKENIVIKFIDQFQIVCLLGIEVLNIYHNNIDDTYKKIKENTYLEKIFRTEDIFSKIFSKSVIDSKYLMFTFDWKRDKAIRFLSSLCNSNLFVKFKSDKKTVFINNIVFLTFFDIKNNSHIQDIIKTRDIKSYNM